MVVIMCQVVMYAGITCEIRRCQLEFCSLRCYVNN